MKKDIKNIKIEVKGTANSGLIKSEVIPTINTTALIKS